LVLPNFTTSLSGPRFSTEQEVFLAITSIGLYAIFLLIQTMRHSEYFMDTRGAGHSSEHDAGAMHSISYHAVMLILYLLVVIVLAEKFAIPLDNSMERFGMPQAFGGAIVAGLVLAPEALSAINAARKNQLQRSVNILHGSVLASIGLTIPAVLTIGMISKRMVTLGIEGGNLPLLLLTGSKRSHVHQRKDKCIARVYSSIAVCGISIADLFPVRFVQRSLTPLGAQVCRPVFRAQC
jgi:Ca2+:H+ antiporter